MSNEKCLADFGRHQQWVLGRVELEFDFEVTDVGLWGQSLLIRLDRRLQITRSCKTATTRMVLCQ